MPTRRYAISCVVDDTELFRRQGLTWIASLAACGATETFAPVIHHIGPPPADFARAAATLGARIETAKAFGVAASAYCNKLVQIDTFAGSPFEEVIFSDADIAFAVPPTNLVGAGVTRAKIVDLANPSQPILANILKRAGFAGERLDTPPDFAPGERTHRFNCNGGVYVLPVSGLAAFGAAWRRWCAWCLAQGDILGTSAVHSDQLGFMLTLIERAPPFRPLPLAANFPTHLDLGVYLQSGAVEAQCLHYHRHADAAGRLRAIGDPSIDRIIDDVNAQIAAIRKTA